MSLQFRPDIEGLRALAIVPVVVFHAFPELMPGGYVGVDVFFVISGFLITSLLMDRLRTQRYSIASFYQARIRRIFPALFLMLAAITPLAIWLLSPSGLWDYRRTLAATALFLSNEELYARTDYFDAASELKPLLHTWSLAVEEQYYIAFPLLLSLLYRKWRRGIVPVLVTIGLASLVLSMLWLRDDPARAFYSAFSRTFELMLGSLLAVTAQRVWCPQSARQVLAALGLALITIPWILFSGATPFPGLAALAPCIGTALLIWTGAQGGSLITQLLGTAPLRWVGAMSFSLYLWHWPALTFARHWGLGEPSAPLVLLAVGLSVMLAWLSLRWVETPVRRASTSAQAMWALAALCISSTLAMAWALTLPRATERSALVASLSQGVTDASPHRARCHGSVHRDISYANSCRFGDLTSPPRTVVWGDSHGVELAFALGEVAERSGQSVMQVTSSACPPAVGTDFRTLPGCRAHNEATLAALVADANVQTVVLIARYEGNLSLQPALFEAGMRQSVDAMTAAGKRVVMIDPIPTYRYPVPDALAALQRRGGRPEDFGMPIDEYRERQRPALEMVTRLAALPGVERYSVAEALCKTNRCATLIDQRSAYFDDNHLSVSGARALVGDGAALLAGH